MGLAFSHYLIITYLLLLQKAVSKVERCGYSGTEELENKETVEMYGSCFPYDTSSTASGTPCDELYEEQVTYVYLSQRRAGGNYQRYLNFFKDTTLFFDLIPEECIDEARKILCHYYMPTCGNSTAFRPPTSVCQDVCEHLRNLCPLEFMQLMKHFETNAQFLAPEGLTMINCSNTGDFIDPLQHCCSDLDIVIPCMKMNGSGDLVPDPECVKSDSVVDPTPLEEMKKGGSNLGVSLGASLTIVFVIMVVTVSVIATVLVLRRRKIKTQKEIGKDTVEFEISPNKGSLRYHEREGPTLLLPPGTSQRVARVPSGFIRQMAEELLLIPERSLSLMDTIGQGEFGVVYRGNLTGWRAKREQNLVAVKTLKGVFGATELSNIMEESVKMAKFNHPNVMRLIGVCIDKGPSPYIVMPYMSYGSLLSYLKKQRAELTLVNDDDQELVTPIQCKLLSICLQIAKGMSYLASQQFVHRDLATRNCMIDENFVLKVADFGLSEDIYARNYFRQTGLQDSEGEVSVKLPVRWMALESLHDGIFTEKTDVWSFGVTMWEIFSCGKTPYPGVDPFTLIRFLDDGRRLDKPNNAACSVEIHLLMCGCWDKDADKRPTFSDLVSTITERLEGLAGYLDFSPTWSSGGQAKVAPYDHLVPEQPKESQNDGKNSYDHLNPTVIISDEHSQTVDLSFSLDN